nr:Ger(x)C family spore germination protein [Sporosarcina limicola]
MVISCLFIVIVPLISGCWSKRELNELAIVVAIGIDKVGEEYEVTVQVVDPSEVSASKSSGGRTPVVMYHAKGESMFEAIRKMTTVTPRKLYFAHIRMMILGEELAVQGIGQTLDFFTRDQELRADFYVAVADQSSAKEVLSILTPLEKIPANKMFNSLKSSSEFWAPTVPTRFDELLKDLESKGRNTVLTTIRIEGDPKQGTGKENAEKINNSVHLRYSDIAVFKNEKMVGLLNEEESKGYNYIRNKVKSTAGIIACPKGGIITTEVKDSKTKVKGKMAKGKPRIDVTIRSDTSIAEVDCDINLQKTETIAELDKIASEKLKGIIEKSLDTIQHKYKVDIFGFGEAIHRADPKAWYKLEKEWEEIFPELEVKLKVDVKTKGLGTVMNSLPKKQKE